MKSKKTPKPIIKDKAWQQKIEEGVKTEKVELDHAQGKNRFERAIKRAVKKNRKTKKS